MRGSLQIRNSSMNTSKARPHPLPPLLRWAVLAVIAITTATAISRPTSASAAESSAGRIDFNRDVRPILSEHCLACHGPDKAKRKAGLRLDLADSATARLDSGHRAVVPGDAGQSAILRAVTSTDDAERMPPAKTGKRLTDGQVQMLRRWIEQGAEFKLHWAYLAPERPPLPAVSNVAWPRNGLDRFVLARLEKEGLPPSPEADKHTLLRRATLDLTGLPPTVEEVDAFLADPAPEAYEKVVDRLLASPAYGEKMAIQWLDLARYADSDGYHADTARSMWQYRDYVIRAFQANKSFDQFTVEQIAGDLLPGATTEQRIATAFNRNGMSSTEGGADPDEYMNKYVTDRVNTFGTVFLGSSTACTECHDHKYDPFTQREYYQLYDFFNRIPERGLDADPAPPFIKVPSAEQAEAWTKWTNEVASLESRRRSILDRVDADADRRQAAWEDHLQRPVHSGWETLNPTSATASSGAALRTLGDLSLLAPGAPTGRETYAVTAISSRPRVTALRLEALTHDSLPGGGSSRATNTSFILTGFEAEAESAHPEAEPPVSEIQLGAWSALGSFKAGSTKELFEKSFIDEAAADGAKPHDGRSWTARPEFKEGANLPLSGENEATYLHRTLVSRTERYVRIRFGSDGGAQLWLNGVKVRNGAVFRRVAPAPEEEMILLRAGENRLLFKVHHGSGVYGFHFAIAPEPVTRLRVEFARALADDFQKDAGPGAALDDRADTGWAIDGRDPARRGNHQALFLARTPVVFAAGTKLNIRLKFESPTEGQVLGRFRLATTSDTGLDAFADLPQSIQTALFAPPGHQTDRQKTDLREHYREAFHPEWAPHRERLADARRKVADLDRAIPTLRVMEDMPEPRLTQIRVRGDYRAKGDAVKAGVPAILPPLPAGDRTNRLTLARWLVDPKHPLLGRVTVNRFWASLFGTGLVKTGNEFGSQGELPSHPELLDWLAREFVDGGWNVKGFMKQLVMSATYRQSSRVRPELLERDPNNRLLARGPRLRLPAEVIRDCALDYSGLLDRRRSPGGPSVRPYQPAGLWEEKMFGGNHYEESKGTDLYRRSLYTLWKRTVLNPTMMTFDAPDRAICTEQRSLTCTPLQAFVTLNEKGYVEAARVFAQRILERGGGTFAERLSFACRTVLARPPSARETEIFTGVHADLFHAYQNDLQAALDLVSTGESKRAENVNQLELAAWTGVANVLLNLDEAITKE